MAPVTVVAVVVAVALVMLPAAVPLLSAAPSPPAIGLPNCPTTCGNVSVPYPFGVTPRCSYPAPGFNLTCDRKHNPPRLLLGDDDTVWVGEISLRGGWVRVIRKAVSINITSAGDGGSMVPGGPYILSSKNEFFLIGCNVHATLLGEYDNSTNIIGECTATCTNVVHEPNIGWAPGADGKYCTAGAKCCQAPISADSVPKGVQFRRLELNSSLVPAPPVIAFLAEQGWFEHWQVAVELLGGSSAWDPSTTGLEFPVVLLWALKPGGVAPNAMSTPACPPDIQLQLCKSNFSECLQENTGYTCRCAHGFDGNPYIRGGCQDVDECNLPREETECFGECINLVGRYHCRCPRGTHGDYSQPNGCFKITAGLNIGIGAGSVAGFVLLVIITIFMIKRIKRRMAIKIKQKFFNQNRGQLLQHLVSQRADIAERMIISVDELAKATNNFDKDRELGGGGHGIVYKGILSDLHVVAIKRSKISVQKEINEFINEVAILSQINHRNVVKLYGCCLETEVPLLVYEFISNGTLFEHIHAEGQRSLSWGNRLRIATEIASALAYLHSSVSVPIIHRDIKSTNILLDDTLTSKISDFGASRYIPIDKTGLTTRVQGTIGYLDPMYFYTGRLTDKSDVYSYGVILVELLTKKKPFSYLSADGDGLVAHFVKLLAEGDLVEILDPQVKEEGGTEIQKLAELAASCIKLRGEDRPTMRQVEHELEALQTTKKFVNDAMSEDKNEDATTVMSFTSTNDLERRQQWSRNYSLEQDILMSATYPR